VLVIAYTKYWQYFIMITIVIIIIIISGSTRPGVTNKMLRDKNIEHKDRWQMQTLPTI